MQCTNCGVELEEGARYCQDCGFPVPGTGSSSVRPVDAATASGRTKRSRATAIIVGVLGVIAVVVVIAAAIALLGGQGSSGKNESDASANAETSFASEAADEAASSSASSSEASSSKASKSKKKKKEFVQANAEAKARKKATAAGMQILSGTLHITTYGNRISKVNSKMASTFSSVANQELAILDFSMNETVYACYTRGGEISAKTNQECIALTEIDKWREFDGQLIVVAAYPGDLVFPNNAAEALYTAIGGAILIAPLNEDRAAALSYDHSELPVVPNLPSLKDAKKSAKDKKNSDKKSTSSASSSSAAAKSNSYMLPDSATRTYTKAELKKLSDYELFIARNEIFARHGRKFQSAELKRYFESKSWYKGTVEAAAFKESVLNANEQANAALIRQIEESRGSKYI
ncbi:MAG: YARHG domain-containing protein [Eggerthellaceae bacterium]|nr:YARHG domain-containing protein [Eggerthellaceae bacterium]